MSHYAQTLARAAGWTADAAEELLTAAPMHDIGKIGIPDQILLKPGPLSAEEWAVMRTHPQIGADIIGERPSSLLKLAREIALHHHEKWDGSGYPFGLQGEAIPASARIVAIADVFDALTTARPYKQAWHVDDALAQLQQDQGKHFDPTLVAQFMTVLPEILAIKEKWKETSAPEGLPQG